MVSMSFFEIATLSQICAHAEVNEENIEDRTNENSCQNHMSNTGIYHTHLLYEWEYRYNMCVACTHVVYPTVVDIISQTLSQIYVAMDMYLYYTCSSIHAIQL